MRNHLKVFTVRASVLAVQGALVTLAALPVAYAQESAAELIKPVNTVELGITNADKGSYKFGEYNGLEKKGATVAAGFEVNGGGGDDSALRYRFTGKDLGLDTRNLGAEFGEQGKFRFTFGYDEIVKNRSDSFQTPYLGAGSNNLTLPFNWATHDRTGCSVTGAPTTLAGPVVVNNVGCGNYYVAGSTAKNSSTGKINGIAWTDNHNLSATPTGNMLALTDAEKADFHNYNLSTQRKKFDLGVNFAIDNQWQISASASHETKQGAQAIGQPFSTTSAQVTLPNPIDYDHNQFELKLNFKGDKAFGQAAYYGSFFKDKIQSVTYENPYFSSAVPVINALGMITYPWNDTGRFASAPSNEFHQLNLTGGYNFSKTTKLVGSASYGRNTQDQSFIPLGTGLWETAPAGVLPQSSLQGLVVTKQVSLKLTAKPIKNLQLLGSYKYDDRDNRTASRLWSWRDTDQQTPYDPSTTVYPTTGHTQLGSGTAGATTAGGMFPNRSVRTAPYSKKSNLLNLEADYGFAKGQAVKIGYDYQKLTRNCDSTAYDCANVKDQKENTARIEYRNSLLENVTGRISYAVADRSAGAYTNSPYLGSGVTSDTITRWLFTDRKRDKLRSSVNWQATDALDLTLSYDYTKDRYDLGKNPGGITLVSGVPGGLYPNGHQPIGLSDAKTDAVNLDINYTVSEKLSFNAFYSEEHTSSLLVANVNPSGAATASNPAWQADMKDKTETYGVGFKALPTGGKWELAGDYTTVRASSPYALSGGLGSVSTTSAYSGIASTFFDYPSVYSNTDTFNFSAKYKVSKSSSWRFSYAQQRLSSADPLMYNGLQTGTATGAVAGNASGTVTGSLTSSTAFVNGVQVPNNSVVPISSLMPTNEKAPNYSVQVIGVTYIYAFH